MKWLVIQSDGQHKGQPGDPWKPNWYLRECYAIAHALECYGDRTTIWGLRHKNYNDMPDLYDFDGIFTCENYEFDWLPSVNELYRAMRVFWVIDAHWQPLNAYAEAIKGYDIVLHSTKKFIKPYEQLYPNQRHLYFPNGVDSRYYDQLRYPPRERTVPLIFIGGKSAPRAAAIDRMVSEAGLDYRYGVTGTDYVDAVRSARMQFNKGLNGDINYRNWETLGLGTCLLTEYDSEMEALGFKHDVNCLFYHTVDEAIALAKEYLANGKWKTIADNGYQFSRNNTYTNRIKRLIPKLLQGQLA